ncbi:MAG: DNA ligase [Nanohaloarchaea archaeon SW_7_43_1]|nr:MAG: DNA ligase [Nanohaloarchaea archaeon SW_7_43_1]
MKFSKLVPVYQELGETQSTLEKTSILADLFKDNPDQLENLVLLCMGRPFPYWKNLDLGISSNIMVEIIKASTGRSEKEIEEVWKKEGDLGIATEKMVEGKTQQQLMTKEVTVERLIEKLEKIAEMEKEGLSESVSQDKKKKNLAELISSSDPVEARYITRIILQTLRLGVGKGIIRDALSEAFFDGKHSEKIQRAYDLTNDFTEVARASKEGVEELKKLEIELFRPINSMLAKKVDTVEEGFEEVGEPAAIDYKFDGMRAQLHKKGDEVQIFTRRLENVTEQFPEVKTAIKNNIDSKECIIDAEIVAYDPDDGSTIPFQQLSKRIKRKYDIQRLKEEIPVELRPFDLIYEHGSKLEEEYQNRWEHLEQIVEEENQTVRMANHKETSDPEEVQKLQQKSLSEGHEGIMMKSMKAKYKPGKRVGYMVKLKPVMETLDLAIIGAKWSEGRRSGWLGRLKLGCWDENEQEYLMIGRMATGLTDEQLEEITEKLKPLVVEEDGREVKVKPEVIIEAEYEEIQKSPNYDSGYALRFPRMKQFREDKDEADSLGKVENLYDGQ